MLRRLAAILLATAALRCNAAADHPHAKIRGMNFAHAFGRDHDRGYGSPASDESLRELRSLGVDSVALIPFGFQRSTDATEIFWVGHGARHPDETDDRIRAAARQAHSHGMSVMLKPHLWLRPPAWSGAIDPQSDAAWNAWFAAYREMTLHYARLATEIHADTFCIGNELTKATTHEREWRAIIADVRRVYHGRLTYGANIDEVFDVPFWDALDLIGVSAYFPLDGSDRDSLARAWQPIVGKLARLSAKQHRPVLFTELGYSSRSDATREPWIESGISADASLQAEAYEAFFRTVWPQPWFAGVYFWKWESYPGHSNPTEISFSIENKPAAAIVRRYFSER